ncbi:hypothetical protein PISL3812_09441 [Talaromyces islandicus]|uniref:Uncharacterized protein n=1 Tax=Talaromyces islandicus TaxID=28573 RepID=A0A0U1MAR4_TALIS|nr:hypothetical protein PISL3812_09441 [Talaromyces islandicus]
MPGKNATQPIDTKVDASGSNPPTAGSGQSILARPVAYGLKPVTRRTTDRNMTDSRLLANRKCIYERRLPGNAYITAHVERLQHGYFGSEHTSDSEIPNVDFLGINFVFHPSDCDNHRFKAATIRATIQNAPMGDDQYPYPQENPKFLMHAPHLIYGAVSPETLQWTFSLAGSLGISDAPVAAQLSPSGSKSGSYKIYEMMKIQGSSRTLRSPDGPEFDVEDGEVVWSLSENALQRSGLPREFTFVMLVQKPHPDSKLVFKLDIDPVIDAWIGRYPTWWLNKSSYQPMAKRAVNFHAQVGQRFDPVDPIRGFNFSKLANSLDDYVNMPGSTYSSNVSPDGVFNDPNGAQPIRQGGGNNNQNSQPIRIPEYLGYPVDEQPYAPLFPPTSTYWETSSPFQRGWPQDNGYYGGPTGNNRGGGNSTESTINVRLVLDNGFTTQLAAAALGNRSPRTSPRLQGSTLGIPPTSDTSPMGRRTRSLRRSRSREDLNGSASQRVYSIADTSNNGEYYSAEPSPELNGTHDTRKASQPFTASDINHTPPHNGIRDPLIVKKTPNRNGRNTTPGAFDDAYLPNDSYTPPSPPNGFQSDRSVSGVPLPRRSVSQRANGYRNRFSYPSAFTE